MLFLAHPFGRQPRMGLIVALCAALTSASGCTSNSSQFDTKQRIPATARAASPTGEPSTVPPSNVSKHDVYNGQRGQSFNREWRFHWGDLNDAQTVDFDDSTWRKVSLPHDYSIEQPFHPNSAAGRGGGYLEGGVGWYRKRFYLPAETTGKRTSIHFDGVYMNSTVWLNGRLLGSRPNGYSTFGFELTDVLNDGDEPNVIAVRVNHEQPSSRWYSGSGIYRNVWLTTLHPLHVANTGVFVHFGAFTKGTTRPEVPAIATAELRTQVENQSDALAHVTCVFTLSDATGVVVATKETAPVELLPHSSLAMTQTLTVKHAQLWSPSHPNLYRLDVELKRNGEVVDTFRTTTGIRYLHFDPNQGFFLNGEHLRIFGAALHHDLGALGAAFNYRAAERRIQLLKDMGANAVRLAHNPHAPEVLEICDRLGMLVMDEAFDCWESAKSTYDYARFFEQWAERDLTDLIRRDRNHPSVVMWSAGNEINGPSLETAQKLRGWILSEDTSRPITWAREGMTHESYQHITDRAFDLAGFNYPAPSLYDSTHVAFPSWSSFGSEVMSGRMSRGVYVFPANQRNLKTFPDWGSSYDNCTSRQAMGHDADFRVYEERPFLLGEFVWAGFDYLGEADWPLKSNNDGKLDTAGFPKDVYYLYQSRLTQTPMVHLLPHWNWEPGGSYDYTEPNAGDSVVPLLSATIPEAMPVTVIAYTNCDEVELFLNGTSLGSRNCGPKGELRCTWEVPFSPGTLEAIAKNEGIVVAKDEVTTAGVPSRVTLSTDRKKIAYDGEDLAFITAQIRDAHAVEVPTADDLVTFSVSGPGEIIAVDNGDSSDTDESYQSTSRRAFAGKCLALLRATAEGTIVVTATAKNLSPQSVTVTSSSK